MVQVEAQFTPERTRGLHTNHSARIDQTRSSDHLSLLDFSAGIRKSPDQHMCREEIHRSRALAKISSIQSTGDARAQPSSEGNHEDIFNHYDYRTRLDHSTVRCIRIRASAHRTERHLD